MVSVEGIEPPSLDHEPSDLPLIDTEILPLGIEPNSLTYKDSVLTDKLQEHGFSRRNRTSVSGL